MSARDVAFTLMALGHVAGCRGKRYSGTEILAEAVGEIVRLNAENEALRSAALGVVAYREGQLPCKGWLRDNDASRSALDTLAKVLTKEG